MRRRFTVLRRIFGEEKRRKWPRWQQERENPIFRHLPPQRKGKMKISSSISPPPPSSPGNPLWRPFGAPVDNGCNLRVAKNFFSPSLPLSLQSNRTGCQRDEEKGFSGFYVRTTRVQRTAQKSTFPPLRGGGERERIPSCLLLPLLNSAWPVRSFYDRGEDC